MQLKGKKAWGVVWDFGFQFRIFYFIYFFQGRKLKNYNILLV